MNDAAQIRRCSGALRAKHSRLRPSFLPPPPAHRQNLKISNREPLRLEIRLTHTKQTLHHHSNRENNASLLNRDQPSRRRNLIISNREPLRLEIPLTHRKQTIHDLSNRENKAWFSNDHHPANIHPSAPALRKMRRNLRIFQGKGAIELPQKVLRLEKNLSFISNNLQEFQLNPCFG
jgi:hypothetical protein